MLLGVSAPGCVTKDMVRSMAKILLFLLWQILCLKFSLTKQLEAGAKVVGTGRSDFPNQINNVLVFPGIFRGALDVRAKEINDRNENCGCICHCRFGERR